MGVKTILDVDRRVKKVFVILKHNGVSWVVAAYYDTTGVIKRKRGEYVILSNGKTIGVAVHIDELKETWGVVW